MKAVVAGALGNGHPRGLVTLYATIGRPEQARAELSAAIALHRSMDMTCGLPQAEAAFAQVEGR
jgi:hypothetical protein